MAIQNLLQIDRSKSFNLATITLCGWCGWLIAEQDERSLVLTEINLSMVSFETMLRSSEVSIPCEEKLKRLKQAGHIRFDVRVFHVLWENQHIIPDAWKSKGNVFFDGTILCNSSGHRYGIFLYWLGDTWRRGIRSFSCVSGAGSPSACLAV